ncbi:MAG: MGMT family protein [Halovenus sp.]
MDDAGIYARHSDFLDRHVQVGLAQGRVISLSFPTTPADEAQSELPLLDRLAAYLDGERDDFEDVTVAMTMPTPHRKVLEKVREIPYGEEATVEQVTRMVPDRDPDDDDDLGTVREALAENPVPLLLPDHRVRDGPSGAPPSVEQKLRVVEGLP